MNGRLVAGIVAGVALALLAPVLQAVGSFSGSHAAPGDSGVDIRRAAAAQWWVYHEWGSEEFTLSAWRRDEAYVHDPSGDMQGADRFVDGGATLIRTVCRDEECTESVMTAALAEPETEFVAEAAAGVATLSVVLSGDAGPCRVRVDWTPSQRALARQITPGDGTIEIVSESEVAASGACLPAAPTRDYTYARVWERVDRVGGHSI